MAIYRNISMNFWTDSKVVDDFSPEDKYFMLYCLTNPYTNLCGCYEISIKQMIRDTGYNEETIYKLLDRLSQYGVVKYNKTNKEIFINNWFKYNWTKSEKLDKPLLEEIKKIKTQEFKKKLSDLYNNRDTVSIPYIYTMDTTVSVSVSDTITDSNIYNNCHLKNDYESEFEQIWLNYPRKQGKKDALKHYIKARKNGTTKEQVLEGLENYNQYIQIEKIESRYIKQGSTWFNQECWKDDYSIKRKMTTKDIEIDISDIL